MAKIGRPKKAGAKVSGQLNANECRFTFICDKELANGVRQVCLEQNLTIKKFMDKVLRKYRNKNAANNEEKLLMAIKNMSKN